MQPIIPFENLPLGAQIFLVLTSIFILVGIGSYFVADDPRNTR